MKILVDADACPKNVLNIIIELQDEYLFKLVTVSSFKHNISLPEHVMVDDEPQAADMAIVNRTTKGDIVVTGDWGLASLVLGKGASAISPSGYIYKQGKIEFMLEERHIKAKIRRGGGRTRGPAARSANDDENFKRSLIKLMERCKDKI